jgi:hypothetical protein
MKKIKSVTYRGVGQYYAYGPLKDMKVDYKKREITGKVKVRLSDEWIETLFLFDNKEKEVIIEWEDEEYG